MRKLLERVVREEGSGVLARVEGFQVAGKTGTSQKVDYKRGGYQKGSYWSSFVGFLPSENPKFVIYVMIDEPQGARYYGGQVAAPVFATVATDAIRMIRSDANTIVDGRKKSNNLVAKEPFSKVKEKAKLKTKTVPDVRGLSLAQAFRSLRGLPIQVEVLGEGTQVEEQLEDQKTLYLRLR